MYHSSLLNFRLLASPLEVDVGYFNSYILDLEHGGYLICMLRLLAILTHTWSMEVTLIRMLRLKSSEIRSAYHIWLSLG